MTGDAVKYASFQEIGQNYPEIPRERFEKAVQLIDTDGTVVGGAEAVFRSLGKKPKYKWMTWAYQKVPGFAGVTETAYRQVARNRQTASLFTRLFWGNDVRPPTYLRSRRWFVRSLGVTYLVAFLSLWIQIDGLIGSRGILPIGDYLHSARKQLGVNAWTQLPTLCWINSSDLVLHVLCGAGLLISGLLIAGAAPVLSLILLFVFYLSLTIAGQTFFNFQWDILLLETGFLAIFFAPACWRMRSVQLIEISRFGHFLLKLLLFKLMLMSGVVKLTSGDASWWDLTALHYHYETQPLPTIVGWWASQCPEWFNRASTFFVIFVETVVPFFIWAPRRLRHLAAGLFVLLQIVIGLTGNYGFFNLLTIVLCLPLIDDSFLARKRLRAGEVAIDLPAASDSVAQVESIEVPPAIWNITRRGAAVVGLAIFLPLNGAMICSAFKPRMEWPRSLQLLYGYVEPFRVVNGYGLFRVMTKIRPEIIIEGSADGVDWLPYEFKWKPGDLHQPPRWVAPHQPRLDWQMWFAALGTYRNNPWFLRLAECLLRNDPAVTRLLARNPFPEVPPLYLRAQLYQYHFTSIAQHRATGDWWKREQQGEYLPLISLKRGE